MLKILRILLLVAITMLVFLFGGYLGGSLVNSDIKSVNSLVHFFNK